MQCRISVRSGELPPHLDWLVLYSSICPFTFLLLSSIMLYECLKHNVFLILIRSLNNEHSNLLRCPARAATDTSLPATHTPTQLSGHERVHWHRSFHKTRELPARGSLQSARRHQPYFSTQRR